MDKDFNIVSDNNLDTAIKAFEKESISTEKQKIEINDSFNSQSKISLWLAKNSFGIIKTEEQVNYTLLGFIIICISLTLFIIFGSKINSKSNYVSKYLKPGQQTELDINTY